MLRSQWMAAGCSLLACAFIMLTAAYMRQLPLYAPPATVWINWPSEQASGKEDEKASPFHAASSAPSETLHAFLSQHDLHRYLTLYQLQDEERWNDADALINRLDNKVLVSDVLAERYLHTPYDTSQSELTDWLKQYADHPLAAEMHQLARRKNTDPALLNALRVAATETSSRYYGIRDGIGGRTLPKAWSAGLDAWQAGEYDAAHQIFTLISEEEDISKWHKSAAFYWAFRSAIHGGYPAKADKALRAAAAYPFTFYGALAATQIAPKHYQRTLPAVSQLLQQKPAVARAFAFAQLGLRDKAERELYHLEARLPHAMHRQLITLADALDLAGFQLRLSQQHYRNQEQTSILAYPTPRFVPEYDLMIDPALLYAIIRQESAFNLAASSHAGAQGIMQIMPATAQYMIERFRLNEVKTASLDMTHLPGRLSTKDLIRPEVNLLIGQHYIRYLADKPYINGNLVYLLAAYNAGPGNLLNWQKRFGQANDPLLFIEQVPFKETRHYIKQVLANYLVYQSMLYGKTDSAPRLQAGLWPKITPMRDIQHQMAQSLPQKLAARQ